MPTILDFVGGTVSYVCLSCVCVALKSDINLLWSSSFVFLVLGFLDPRTKTKVFPLKIILRCCMLLMGVIGCCTALKYDDLSSSALFYLGGFFLLQELPVNKRNKKRVMLPFCALVFLFLSKVPLVEDGYSWSKVAAAAALLVSGVHAYFGREEVPSPSLTECIACSFIVAVGGLWSFFHTTSVIERKFSNYVVPFIPVPFYLVVRISKSRFFSNQGGFFFGVIVCTFLQLIFSTFYSAIPSSYTSFFCVSAATTCLAFYAATSKQREAASADSSQRALNGLSNDIKALLRGKRERKLFLFLLLTLSVMVLELVYGLVSNSLGLISDSFHMMLDGASIIVGLCAAHASTWLPNSKTHPFGYGRYEVLGGFINGVLLLFIAIFVILESVERIIDPPEMQTSYLLAVSIIGLLVNAVGLVFFHEYHGHSHAHSHGECSSHSDHNMRGVYLHILADLLGSVSVIISSLLIQFFGLLVADPICSVLSAGLIFVSAIPLLEETGKVLLLSAPESDRDFQQFLGEQLAQVCNVASVDDVKLWINSTPPRELVICTVSCKQVPTADYFETRKSLMEKAKELLSSKLGVSNANIVLHVE